MKGYSYGYCKQNLLTQMQLHYQLKYMIFLKFQNIHGIFFICFLVPATCVSLFGASHLSGLIFSQVNLHFKLKRWKTSSYQIYIYFENGYCNCQPIENY